VVSVLSFRHAVASSGDPVALDEFGLRPLISFSLLSAFSFPIPYTLSIIFSPVFSFIFLKFCMTVVTYAADAAHTKST